MKCWIVFLQLLSLGLSAPSSSLPSFEMMETRSTSGEPKVLVTFPNGEVDTLRLKRFNSNSKDRNIGQERCNFVGHLEKETEACVALTGCIGGPMELTILSKNIDFSSTYLWNKNGEVELIEHPFKDGNAWTETLDEDEDDDEDYVQVGDQEVNIQQEIEEAKIEAKCAIEGCETLPPTMLMELKIVYGSNFLARFDNRSHELARDYIEATLAHAQALFCHETLGTALKVETVEEFRFLDQEITASVPNLKAFGNYTAENLGEADLIAIFGSDEKLSGVVGIGSLSSVCKTKKNGAKSINEWRKTASSMAKILAHEIGHNLGMKHDFANYHGGMESPCNHEGLMSYGWTPKRWSECSKADFQAHYLRQKENWCMEEAPDACMKDGK